jgi:hypothetical protein
MVDSVAFAAAVAVVVDGARIDGFDKAGRTPRDATPLIVFLVLIAAFDAVLVPLLPTKQYPRERFQKQTRATASRQTGMVWFVCVCLCSSRDAFVRLEIEQCLQTVFVVAICRLAFFAPRYMYSVVGC